MSNRKHILKFLILTLVFILNINSFTTTYIPTTGTTNTTTTGVKKQTETAEATKETQTELASKGKKINELLKQISDTAKNGGQTEELEKQAKELGATETHITDAKKGTVADEKAITNALETANNTKENVNIFVKAIDELEKKFDDNIQKIVNQILQITGTILGGLAIIQVFTQLIPVMSGGSLAQIPLTLLAQSMKLGFVSFLFMSGTWWNIVESLRKFFLSAGIKFATDVFKDVDSVTTGNIAVQIMSAPFKVLGFSMGENTNIVWRLMFLLTGIALLFICLQTIANFLVATIEYKLLGGLSGIYLIFLIWDKTASFGMKAFNTILSNGMKLMIIVAIISLMLNIVDEQNKLLESGEKPTSVFVFLALMAIMSYMASIAPQQAGALISGSGGAATGAGFVQSMAKQAATATTLAIAAATGGLSLGGAITEGFKAVKEQGVKKAIGSGLRKAGTAISNKARDSVSGVGGMTDAVGAAISTKGKLSDKLSNAISAYKNNHGVQQAKVRKLERQAKAEKRKKLQKGASQLISGIILAGGMQKSLNDVKQDTARVFHTSDQNIANISQRQQDLMERMAEQGQDMTAFMSEKGYKDYLKNTGQDSTVDMKDKNVELDFNNNELDNGSQMIDEQGVSVADTDSFVQTDGAGNILKNSKLSHIKQTDKFGNQFMVDTQTGKVYRAKQAGEKIRNGAKSITAQNKAGQKVEFVEITDDKGNSGATVNANGHISFSKQAQRFSVAPNVENIFNSKTNIDAIYDVENVKNISVERLSNAVSDIASAQATLSVDSSNIEAKALFDSAQQVIIEEGVKFGGNQDDFNKVMKNITNVRKHTTSDINVAKAVADYSGGSITLNAEQIDIVRNYKTLKAESKRPTASEETLAKVYDIEQFFENKGFNINDRKLQKGIAKAVKVANNSVKQRQFVADSMQGGESNRDTAVNIQQRENVNV